jgi:hypothetical protein
LALPVTFTNLSAGNQPLSLFDTQFAAVAALGVIPCSASGQNAIVLTPNANTPTISGYTDLAPSFSFAAAQTSSTTVTINVAGIGARNAYRNNGLTQCAANDLVAGNVYKATFLSALNTGAGGFVVDVIDGKQLAGTTTNDSAAAGNVGELISSTVLQGAAVALTTGVAANITSISLTAGDWDVFFNAGFIPAAATTITLLFSSISTTSANLDNTSSDRFFETIYAAFGPGANTMSQTVGPRRMSLGGTTTVFAVAQANFAVSTLGGYGVLRARRVR